ncbi:GntR family transcriptional regulator [Microbacterium resistens]|uniref:GntR family transcriptional regulator n=1 Tax=Microbacterium resistens TaxID=156977 RepID=UPI001C5A3147|nr:GntR family transcriptional regulator [Microbacterium resistens]MBW1640649.1 GntR family transcriptional regulator [Microbacterium resistens]MDA4893461.1 GntR family transcriptional regulator [Streptomyces sp. MS2A]
MATSVYERIRDAIVEGRIAPGAPLSENGLAKDFGTSRTPVREALHRLEIEALVERLPRGVQVRETSPEEIIDIYDVRITLEGAAARAAAERATEFDQRRLRAAQEAMRAAGADPRARARANRQFHEAVWSASHSPTLVDLLHRLNVHLVRYPTTTLEGDDRWAAALDEHEAMLDAIEARDAARAREIAEAHMTAAREVRMRMYAEAPAR